MQREAKPQFVYRVPTLAKGVLRQDILLSMRDAPLVDQQLRYIDYSDGILSGCHLYEENGTIGVEPGMVKFAGRYYTLAKRVGVPYEATDDWTVLKIAFRPESSSREFTIYKGDLVLDANTFIAPNEMELGRFKLKRGSSLRTQYKDFADMTTEYDTVHVTHVKMAGVSDDTLHPSITWNFGIEAYHLAQAPHDVAFCSLCLMENRPISRLLIQQYIFRRAEVSLERLSNEEMHLHLTNTLREIQAGKGMDVVNNQMEGSMLLL